MPKIDAPLLIAGLGSMGYRHLCNLRSLGCSNIILYRTGKGVLPDKDVLAFPVEESIEKALAHQPAGVIVSNPNSLHMPVAVEAAKAGCQIFLEKPVSHGLDGIEELRQEVKKHNLFVLVGFQFRFHPALRQIKDWLDEGVMGEIISVQAHWGEFLPGWHPGEDYRKGYSARADLGGGVILTLCHPFDYLRWLIGEIDSVFAMANKSRVLNLDVEDTAQSIIRFRGGAVGNVYLDYHERPPSHWLKIIGQNGTICWNNSDGAAYIYRVDGAKQDCFSPLPGFERNTMFMEEMRHFLKCMNGEENPLCTLDDGISALKVCLAIKRSVIEKREINICDLNY